MKVRNRLHVDIILSKMRTKIIYFYVVVMFTCLLGGTSLSQPYEDFVLLIGLFLFGMFFIIGMPFLWRKKKPLRGQGVIVEFSKHPIIYSTWLFLFFCVGIAITSFAIMIAVKNYLGVVLAPWL